MAISGLQIIDVGLQNEATGSDSLYTAFNKTKNNFAILANTANYSNFTGNTGISVNANISSGRVDITNTGVISLIQGTGITLSGSNGNVTINSTGGGGGGSVTSVGISPVSSSRLTVSNTPITTSGNISIDLADSGVTAGSYTIPSITVDTYGRITSISNGSSVGSQITNGNSNVVVGANSDVIISAGGTANVLVVSNNSATLAGNLIAGNVSSELLTGTITTSAQPNITSLGSLTYLIVNGNINSGNNVTNNSTSGNIFTGNITANGTVQTNTITTGSNVTAGTMTGNWVLSSGSKFAASYATTAGTANSASQATYADSAGFTNSSAIATKAGTVTTNAQPNITSVGSLTSLIVSGNINAGNLVLATADRLRIAGGTSGYVLQTDGASNLSWVAQSGGGNGSPGGSNTQVQFNDSGAFNGNSSFTFNKSTGTLVATVFQGGGNNLSNITGANVSGQVANALVAGTVTTTAQPNITSTGTLTSLTVSGNASIGNISTTGEIVATGNVTANNFVGGGSGTPTLSSTTNLDLSAGTSVRVVGGGTFRLPSLNSTQIANLIPVNGDMIYNSTTNKFQGFENGAWANLI